MAVAIGTGGALARPSHALARFADMTDAEGLASAIEPAGYMTATATRGRIAGAFADLFAELDRHTFSLPTRLNVTFSRSLTLQLFAQPLISAGDYVTYKQLARAGTYAFQTFTEGTATAEGCAGGTTCVFPLSAEATTCVGGLMESS